MKICPRLLIFELSDCTLRIFRGYDFNIFLILLFLDRYFGVFDSDLRASPPVCLVMECPPPGPRAQNLLPVKQNYVIHLIFLSFCAVITLYARCSCNCHADLLIKLSRIVIRFIKGRVIRHECPTSMNSRMSKIS